MTDEKSEIQEILLTSRVIAIVGLSADKTKPSYEVAAYMKKHGYRIVPVNPFVNEVLGEKSYKSLLEIPADIQKQIGVVDIFRRSEDVTPVVQEAIILHARTGKPRVVWMQSGIVNQLAAQAARKAGLTVIMDRCMMVEHKKVGS